MQLSEDSSSDLFGFFCGKELGRGQYRTVYEHQLEKKRVIKHDTCVNWSNVNEFQIFQEYQDSPIGKWQGRPVCHDYGNNALHRLAKKPAAAMQSVVWEHHV